jgi:hypothetical protein
VFILPSGQEGMRLKSSVYAGSLPDMGLDAVNGRIDALSGGIRSRDFYSLSI